MLSHHFPVNPLQNALTSCSEEMREKNHLLGRLPYSIEPMAEQVQRHYAQLLQQQTLLQKNRYLHQLAQYSTSLFYTLMSQHLKEMLPILYTPTVSQAVKTFNQAFLIPQGLFIAWPHREKLDSMLKQYEKNEIDIAILTDGERVLGLGDQGVGGIEICLAKSMLYTLCAKINPQRILPIYLDVGTNNENLLASKNYKGWRNKRIHAQEYDDFIAQVIDALSKKFSHLYFHWEDLERDNAKKILIRYNTTQCTFNDDMQGTGIVTVASALNAMHITQSTLSQSRIIIYGGGTAGIGIADQFCAVMQREGLTIETARKNIWLIGRHGLLMQDSVHLTALQIPYARSVSEKRYYATASTGIIDLFSVVEEVKPHFLIGCSGKGSAFTEKVIKEMAKHTRRPIIFPLSNPTEKAEAIPSDLLHWTEGRALIATGSPFEPVGFRGQLIPIAQCNNALVFPGIGLGVKASHATQLTEEMLWKACEALCHATNLQEGRLLPDMIQLQKISQKIACAVIQAAQQEGVARNKAAPTFLISQVMISF